MGGLGTKERIQLTKVFLERWCELICEEIDKDLQGYEKKDAVEQVYLASYWSKTANYISEWLITLPRATTTDDKWKLIEDVYGTQLGLPSYALKPDVKNRLEWLKRIVARDFEKEIKTTIDHKAIKSPIEQIFLMEWKAARLDEKLKVNLCPQENIETENGVKTVDFLIRPCAASTAVIGIVIELDGHEFHEKTKWQVSKDKARERAIVRKGLVLLRFSGTEVVKNARGCVEEVADYVRSAEGQATLFGKLGGERP
jgi:very-short-patch-repair endonuclease